MEKEKLIQLNNSISKLYGIYFHEDRLNELQRAIQSTCRLLKIKNTDELISKIVSHSLSDIEQHTLIKQLTIGETYFFRDPIIFTQLKDVILPDVIKRKGLENIKIMSIGCSTGEEAYSIAITIDRYIPQLKPKIIGLDINEESIQKAKAGVYKKWSFRKSPKWLIVSYFEKTDENTYRINEHIKSMVEFYTINIADTNNPFSRLFQTIDIVFCRNVIMYFSENVRRYISETIYKMLTDYGWLIVSPIEASPKIFAKFKTINTTKAILYQKAPEQIPYQKATHQIHPNLEKEPPRFLPHKNLVQKETTHQPSYHHLQTKNKTDSPVLPSDEHHINISDILDKAIKNANNGRFEEAENLLLNIVKIDNLNPETYFLLASIAEEKGDLQSAEDAIKKVIYINPNHPVAYFKLGNILMKLEKKHDALRAFNSALTLLNNHHKDMEIHGADGLNTERLREICQKMITEIEVK